MKSHQITIKDIARILEISPSTVSRALKNHPDISPETKKLVQTFAEKVKYRPNALALSLRSSKTFTIGVIIPEIVHHFFSSVISGIEDVAYAAGYKVMMCQSNENDAREAINIQALLDSQVDGILISVSKTTRNSEPFQRIVENNTPIVFFDRVCEEIESDRVIVDDREGARIATQHLISLGCKQILILGAPLHMLIGKQRLDGYKLAHEQNELAINPSLFMRCDTRDDVTKQADAILSLAPHIDGIFAVNDSTAIAAMQLLMKNGYKIPTQIKVIGFGDGPNATITSPSLSTVGQKGNEIGQEATRMLLTRISNPDLSEAFHTRVLTPELIVRESTTI
ncbi:MAG: LacI family DNA-binding transcriptional regulator [Marinilabiliaceae bacterium]|nr:LacI family DNA-binding transcriptional regulator [Marinilabiliaceae bacterium]